MDCKCSAHLSYRASGDTMKVILEKVDYCPKHEAVDELVAALENVEAWLMEGVPTTEVENDLWHPAFKKALLTTRAALQKAKS